MRWIWGLIRGILVLFRLFLAGVAFTAGAGGLYGLLFMFFFAVGLVLVLFGFDLDKVDIWLDAHADWFEAAGTFLIKALLAIILAGCVYIIGKAGYDRLPLPGRPSRRQKHRAARGVGKHHTNKAAVGQRMARTKGAPRLSESGELLPGAEGSGERMTGYGLETEHGTKPMGCGAVIAALVAGYFCYIGLTNDF